MKQVVFWGTRGSLPVALSAREVRHKLKTALLAAQGHVLTGSEAVDAFIDTLPFDIKGGFGGNSPCVEILTGGAEHFICDMGTGARPLGQAKVARYGKPRPQVYHIFISHLHWDHLMGLPFFEPMYLPGNQIIFHGCHERLEEAIRMQMRHPGFPVDFSQLQVSVSFDIMEPDVATHIAGVSVTPKLQFHPGDSYGYRFEGGGKTVVYSTDSEHQLEIPEEQDAFIQFFSNADLVIFDAMYSLADATTTRRRWGHSSNIVGAELCLAARAKKLVLFHHDPAHDDAQLCRLLEETRRFEALSRDSLNSRRRLHIISAYDGLTVDL